MNPDQNYTPNPQAFFKTTATIHAALLIGQVLFGVVAFFITKKNIGLNLTPGNDPFFYIALVLVISGMLMGSFLYKQQLAKMAGEATLKEKKAAYQTALVIRCALSEGPSLFCIICFLLTGNLFYLILTGINLLYFIWIRPTQDKIADELSLSYEDKVELGWVI